MHDHLIMVLILGGMAWHVLIKFVASNQWATKEEYEALQDWIEHAGEEARVKMTTIENRVQEASKMQERVSFLEGRVDAHGRILTKLGLSGSKT